MEPHLAVFWKFVANFKVFWRRNVNYVASSEPEFKKYLCVFQSRGSNERRVAKITLKCTFSKLTVTVFHQSSSFLSKEETSNNFSKYKPSYTFCTPVRFAKVYLAKRVLKGKCEVLQNLWGRISGQKETWYMWFECESPRSRSLLWLTKELDIYIQGVTNILCRLVLGLISHSHLELFCIV